MQIISSLHYDSEGYYYNYVVKDETGSGRGSGLAKATQLGGGRARTQTQG